MIINYQVPDDLIKYLEYVPENKVVELITKSLWQAVNSETGNVREEVVVRQPPNDTNQELLHKILEILQTSAVVSKGLDGTTPDMDMMENTIHVFEQVVEEVVKSGGGEASDATKMLKNKFKKNIMK